ncbi:hypothetical protein [Flavobacterium sediminis]|uniref:hypothetical protein n=1 Tax=Flavobacterium sediminis TaxID=2201181 RepID=UPI0015D0983E|nr:hypothetical protein [Flavobacterium sediminis]
MKKIFYTVVMSTLLLTTVRSLAQEKYNLDTPYDPKFKLGIGLSIGAPLQDPYESSLGGDVRLQYDFSKPYSLTLTTGYNNLFVNGSNNDLGYIPLKGGFKAFVLKDKFYLMGEAGAAFAVTNGYDKTSLLLSPTIGYATQYIDLSLRYEHLSDFPTVENDQFNKGLGQIMIRLAYGFNL